MTPTFILDGTNWSQFFDRYWNKSPVVIKHNQSNYKLTANELFSTLATTCDAFHQDDETQMKLYVNNKQIIQDLQAALPSKKLKGFEDHANLIKEKFNSETYTLYVNGLLSKHPMLWMKYFLFLKTVFSQQDIHYQSVDFEVFAGRYESTAGGVHQESCSNFHFLVHGEKTMRVWHPDQFDSHALKTYPTLSERYLLCSDYTPYLADSIPLTGESGDILYWPAGYWHVGESKKVSASVNLAMYRDTTGVDFVMQQLKQFVSQHQTNKYDTIADSIHVIQKNLADANFKNSMAESLTSQRSSYGLEKIATRKLNGIKQDTILTPAQTKLTITAFDDRTLLYGAFGHMFKIEKNEKLLTTLNYLNETEATSQNELKEKFSFEKNDAELIEKIITDLYTIHWLSAPSHS